MKTNRVLTLIAILFLAGVGLVAVHVAAQDDSSTQAAIENAMSAAPPAIAENATILGRPTEEGGDMVVLREGTNGWTCIPDWPVSPGNDPICLDETFAQWDAALAGGTDPELTSPGLAYMLQGGSDPSNTDPLAMEPAEGEDWIATPPHIMIVFPTPLDPSLFPTDHAYGGPYVMWAGTPYEHIMMPVADMVHHE